MQDKKTTWTSLISFQIQPQTWPSLELSFKYFTPPHCVFTMKRSPSLGKHCMHVDLTYRCGLIFGTGWKNEKCEAELERVCNKFKLHKVPASSFEPIPSKLECVKCLADSPSNALEAILLLCKSNTSSMEIYRIETDLRKWGQVELTIYLYHKHADGLMIRRLISWFHELRDGVTLFQTVDFADSFTGQRYFRL